LEFEFGSDHAHDNSVKQPSKMVPIKASAYYYRFSTAEPQASTSEYQLTGYRKPCHPTNDVFNAS
jgi:hypothetical protein